MFKSVRVLFRCISLKQKPLCSFSRDKNSTQNLLNAELGTLVPSRTAIIVKRPFPPTLYKEGNKPRLRKRTFYLDFVEDTNNRPDPVIDIVLSSYVQGVGNAGDLISMKRSVAYNKLLITGLAEYASPEMVEYSKKIKADERIQGKQVPVSVERCMEYLERTRMSIVMNQFEEWTIEPWHIRASARKAGIHILFDGSIELPPKPIKGPDMALEGKEFYVFVTINKKFKVKVKCIIHHWTANPAERLPYKPEWWLASSEMLFPDDAEVKQEHSPPLNTL